MKERHSIYSTVADPGEGPGGVRPPPPIFRRRAEKHFFGRPKPPPPPPSPFLRVMTGPTLSQGLDPAIQHHSPGITLNLRCERLGD